MHRFQTRDKASGMFALMNTLAVIVENSAEPNQKVGVSVEEPKSETLIGDDRSVKIRLMLDDEIHAEAFWDYDTDHWVITISDSLAKYLL